MKLLIAIHESKSGFHPRWVQYCENNKIPFKVVDCYSNDIVSQLTDCSALMWHYSHINAKDILIAKQIMFALEHTGLKVFPDFKTAWHFDDKVAQKYLLERIGAPIVKSDVFFDENKALEWIKHAEFPLVFKLRKGAGSQNVEIVTNRDQGVKIVQRAFKKGFSIYNKWGSVRERLRKFNIGIGSIEDILKGVVRVFYEPEYSRIVRREYGYVYFQDYISNNDSDVRVIVIGDKAFAIRRMVREGDFRASGSGLITYDKDQFDERYIKIAFEVSEKLKSQCTAFDFLRDQDGNPKIVEISYGFEQSGYDECPGHWDCKLNWHEGSFNPQGWMVDLVNDRTISAEQF